jgi:hypothetical protein
VKTFIESAPRIYEASLKAGLPCAATVFGQNIGSIFFSLPLRHGDQIGRMFASRAIVYFEQFFYKSTPNFHV